MYFRGWLHSWTCKNCAYADVYWRLRAFWAGVKRKVGMPKRCPDPQLWHDMWNLGAESAHDELEF
jgi:hypothetical protein|nr:MAG TPA: hypothetical protein [Caudoviricetes sp.]